MCDGRLFHRRAAATGNALSPTVDRRVRRTSRDVDEAEVVVWLQGLLVDVVRHTGPLANNNNNSELSHSVCVLLVNFSAVIPL